MLAKAAGDELARYNVSLKPTNLRRTASECPASSTDPKFAEKYHGCRRPLRRSSRPCGRPRSTRRAKSKRSTGAQPGLPMKPGRAGTMTHDYKRHGTTTLFAALNILDGTVIGRNMHASSPPRVYPLPQYDRGAGSRGKGDPRRRRQLCDPQAPKGAPMAGAASPLDIPLHLDLRASWLNAVEGFFAKLTRQRFQRGVFRSVADLQSPAINRFVADTNADPKPFAWTADPKRVLAAVKRGKQTLESVH